MNPSITSSSSSLLNGLKTQKVILAHKTTSYRELKETQLENSVTKECKKDRKAYQEAPMSTKNSDADFKHLKFMTKSSALPEKITWVERTLQG